MPAWFGGRRVRLLRNGEIGTVSFVEHRRIWVVWPPSSSDYRYSAGGYSSEQLQALGNEPLQISLFSSELVDIQKSR